MADLQRLPLGDVVFRVQQLLVVGEHLQSRRETFRHQDIKEQNIQFFLWFSSGAKVRRDAMTSSPILTPPTSLSVAQRRQSARRAGTQVLAGNPLYLLPLLLIVLLYTKWNSVLLCISLVATIIYALYCIVLQHFKHPHLYLTLFFESFSLLLCIM